MAKTIYTIVGDFYHDHDFIISCVQNAVRLLREDLGEEIEVVDADIADIMRIIQEKPSLILMNKEDRLNPQDPVIRTWLTPEVDDAMNQYVKEGGHFLAMHAALASYAPETALVQMCKGYFLRHPEENSLVRFYANDGGYDFTVMDEHYFVYCMEDETEVFLHSMSKDGSSVAGWRHLFGEGKVLCITPTHRVEGLGDVSMHELLKDCISWCLVS